MHRILHVCNYTWETGGPPSVILAHAAVQNKYAIEQHIFSSPDVNQHIYPLNSNQRLFVFKKSWISKILPDFSWDMIAFFFKHHANYQTINSHGLWNLGSILPFIIPNRAKKIVTLHGFLDDYVLTRSAFSKKIFWNLIQKWCLIKADFIHVISLDELEFVKTNFPFLASKLVYIPNGLAKPKKEIDVLPAFKTKIDNLIEDNDLIFLFLGRLNKKKGLNLLLPAFIEFQQNSEFKVKLLLVGPDDGMQTELEAFVNSTQNFNHSILIFEPVKGAEKDYLLRNCHVFVLPSFSEGFSIAALEAISYGIPGIYSKTIGFARDVAEYNAGLICELTVESIIDRLKQISSNAKIRTEIAENGLTLFSDKYLIEKVAKSYIDQFISLT
jgi:glycosyltransferase involved in cell wall biosynthesis